MESIACPAEQSALRRELLTDSEALEELAVEWRQLWERAPSAGTFQSPTWLLPWWRAFGNDRLASFTWRTERDGRLVGLLPGYILDDTWQLLGVGNSDRLDLLCEPAWQECIAGLTLADLTAVEAPWSAVEFQRLPQRSPLLAASAGPGWTGTIRAQAVCPVFPLPERPEDLCRCASAHLLRNVRYYRRQAEKLGIMELQTVGGADLEEAFHALLELHARRWAEREERDALTDATVQHFLHEAAWALLNAGQLRMSLVRMNGKIAAVLLGFIAHRRFCYYIPGFDPLFAKLQLGNQLVAYAIEQAIAERCTLFDFLSGGESYKYDWGAKDEPVWNRKLARAA